MAGDEGVDIMYWLFAGVLAIAIVVVVKLYDEQIRANRIYKSIVVYAFFLMIIFIIAAIANLIFGGS